MGQIVSETGGQKWRFLLKKKPKVDLQVTLKYGLGGQIQSH